MKWFVHGVAGPQAEISLKLALCIFFTMQMFIQTNTPAFIQLTYTFIQQPCIQQGLRNSILQLQRIQIKYEGTPATYHHAAFFSAWCNLIACFVRYNGNPCPLHQCHDDLINLCTIRPHAGSQVQRLHKYGRPVFSIQFIRFCSINAQPVRTLCK